MSVPDGIDPKDWRDLMAKLSLVELEHFVGEQLERQRECDAEALVREFPELADPDLAEQVVRTAYEWAAEVGLEHRADDPRFWRLIYLARRAVDDA